MLTNHVLLLQSAARSPQMTAAGWVFLTTAWAAIVVVTVWTFWKILRGK